MSSLLRIGRGGAGNFVSQNDAEEAEKSQQANDPEAQKSSSPPPPKPSSEPTTTTQYVRSGRGGAGNFAEQPTAVEVQERADVVNRTTAAVSAAQASKPRTGWSGRGGAGNWAADDEGEGGDKKAEEQRQRQIADQVVHDIESSLPPPPKTYHQHDRDME